MKAVAIKKGQMREKEPADFQEMGVLRCDGGGEEFVICTSRRLRINGALINKHIGSKRCLRKSTSATRSTPTG
jgi:hypothetical protein